MKYNKSTTRNTLKSGLVRRASVAVAVLTVGIFFAASLLLNNSSVGNVKVNAADQEFGGGASPEMLAFGMNFKTASDFAVFSGRNIRNRGESTFRGSVGSVGTVSGIENLPEPRNPVNYAQAK